MNLLIDIGNTRIKWGIENNTQIRTRKAINYKQADFVQQFNTMWSKLETPRMLAISSVSSEHIVQPLITLAKGLWPDITVVMAKSSAQSSFVRNAYPAFEKLGVDRWLGLIALQHYYPGYGCVIDCGTAITIDCIDNKGQHLGGLISPGLQLMKRSLSQETEALGVNSNNYSVGLANQTEPAIYTGTLFAIVGLIEKTVSDLMTASTLILTGGDAEIVASNLALETIIEPDFVLKGLSLYCKEVVS